MESRRVEEEISFSEEKMQKNSLFDSPHLFYDAYCLLPGQAQKVHAHEGSDKIYYVLRGTGRFTSAKATPSSPAQASPTASATRRRRTWCSSSPWPPDPKMKAVDAPGACSVPYRGSFAPRV